MSIVALKRNSRRFKVPVSANGFSLNGTLRNIGSVGQTNLAKSVTRTPFRGPLPMGHGCINGAYPVVISNSGSCCSNDPNIIKKSTKNTRGHILESFIYPTCANGNCSKGSQSNWVKDTTALNNSQGVYISEIINESGKCNNNDPTKNNGIKKCITGCTPNGNFIGAKKHFIGPYAKNVGFINSASNYMRTGLPRKNCLPTPANKQHFPVALLHDGCDINVLTPKQGVQAGILPQDYKYQ